MKLTKTLESTIFITFHLFAPPVASHPNCEPLETYQAPYVSSTYSRSNHMGNYYELAFRDLYPAPPHSDCQHTSKFIVDDYEYDESFRFSVIEFGTTIPTKTLISIKDTAVDLVVDQIMQNITIMNRDLPSNSSTTFHTTVIAFSPHISPNSSQYEWLIEFTCGSEGNPLIPLLFPNDFVGINLYSKSSPHSPRGNSNLLEMMSAIEELGLTWATESEPWKGMDTGFNIVPHGVNCTYEF
ncbi:hypothetical protein TrVE_jg12869 [Triparma verrucosa]|uniref:Uncharacterized protein n=1 Tax=Triparma verrucosa TaxID=1606542 RepID=A0A9W7F707_9STRA|nr:hypothetical protein TrVE_jg12869 [Triparma verrucosa]